MAEAPAVAGEVGEGAPGYVFLCRNQTQPECLSKNLFAANDRDFDNMARSIGTSTQIFLLNVNNGTLVGNFAAVGAPERDIEEGAFGGGFGSQLRVFPMCEPILGVKLEKRIKGGPMTEAELGELNGLFVTGQSTDPWVVDDEKLGDFANGRGKGKGWGKDQGKGWGKGFKGFDGYQGKMDGKGWGSDDGKGWGKDWGKDEGKGGYDGKTGCKGKPTIPSVNLAKAGMKGKRGSVATSFAEKAAAATAEAEPAQKRIKLAPAAEQAAAAAAQAPWKAAMQAAAEGGWNVQPATAPA